jgi:hypothetical protein
VSPMMLRAGGAARPHPRSSLGHELDAPVTCCLARHLEPAEGFTMNA